MEDPLVPAAMLVAAGVQLIVVGSAALVVYGDLDHANDLDIVPKCTASNLAQLRAGLRHLAYHVPTIQSLARADVATIQTSFGSIDLLLERGRREFDALAGRARAVDVHGVSVALSSRADAWRLRHRFKVSARG